MVGILGRRKQQEDGDNYIKTELHNLYSSPMIYYGDQIMGWECNMHKRDEKCIQNFICKT